MSFARYCNFKKLISTGNLVSLYTNLLFLFVSKCNESETNKEGFGLSVASRRIGKSVIMANKSREHDLTKSRGQYTVYYIVKQ